MTESNREEQHSYQRYEGTDLLHLQSPSNDSSLAIMEAAGSSESSKTIYQSTRCHITGDGTQQNRCENIKCQEVNPNAEMSYLISRHDRSN